MGKGLCMQDQALHVEVKKEKINSLFLAAKIVCKIFSQHILTFCNNNRKQGRLYWHLHFWAIKQLKNTAHMNEVKAPEFWGLIMIIEISRWNIEISSGWQLILITAVMSSSVMTPTLTLTKSIIILTSPKRGLMALSGQIKLVQIEMLTFSHSSFMSFSLCVSSQSTRMEFKENKPLKTTV